ncbi:contactin-3-like [Mytilus trossulus]|uniref:contactin-3-like n=1 Tax=Mytilus trossulus TaxID=6551 RepID=UPI003006991F
MCVLIMSMPGYVVSSMYFENSLKKTWRTAYSDCIDRGMELAILNSATSYNTAKTLIEGSFRSGGNRNADVWIGYYFKDVSTKEYAWINGEKSSYENWNPSDPDYKEDSCVRLKQRGQYKFADWDCSGEHFYLCTSGSPPVVEDTTNAIDTTLGSSVSFDCSYTSLWDTVVQWVHITPNRIRTINESSEPVLYSQSIHSVGTFTKSTLHITSFNSFDVGSYQCQVTNQFGTGMGKNNTLKKHKNFLYRDGDYTWYEAKAGCKSLNMELAVLSTTIDHKDAVDYLYSNNFNPDGIWIGLYSDLNYNTSQFVWINGVQVMPLDWDVNEPNDNQISNQSTCVRMKPSYQYSLEDFKCTDTSPYLCTEGSAPSVFTTQSSISLPIRTVVLLECPYFTLWNITNIQWQRQTSQETVILDHAKDSNIYRAGTIYNTSLVITSLDVNNDGLYRCFVENKFGLGRGEDITVTTNPDIPTIVPTTVIYRVNESANITLTCESFGYPNITTQKWTRSLHGSTLTLKTSSMYLDITNASVSDSGNYTCYVENAEGSTKLVYSLYVKEGIPMIVPTTTFYDVNVSSTITLTCDAYGYPSISNQYWTRSLEGSTEILKTSSMYLNITKASVSDSGNYTCYVENDVGSRKLVYSVYVNEAETLCPCVCDGIDNQNLSHYSFEELKIILAPVTDKLQQTLSVDTSTLSSTIYKRTCMQDNRPSSKRIGYCGIGFLCSVFSVLFLIDITSFKCFGTFK